MLRPCLLAVAGHQVERARRTVVGAAMARMVRFHSPVSWASSVVAKRSMMKSLANRSLSSVVGRAAELGEGRARVIGPGVVTARRKVGQQVVVSGDAA